jgi:hypothetical protein
MKMKLLAIKEGRLSENISNSSIKSYPRFLYCLKITGKRVVAKLVVYCLLVKC